MPVANDYSLAQLANALGAGVARIRQLIGQTPPACAGAAPGEIPRNPTQ